MSVTAAALDEPANAHADGERVLRVQGLRKRYGATEVVRGLGDQSAVKPVAFTIGPHFA